MSERETWTSRAGFIAAAVGSAVGLGNIWAFPFQVGRNGGAAFVAVYLFIVLLVGVPAILVEFVIGRRSRRNPIDAFAALGRGNWKFAGALGALIAFWILAFYSVVGGWVLRYILGSITGAYFGGSSTNAYFTSIAMGGDAVLFHAIFMLFTVGIVAFGVENGIERSTKLMIPSIIILLIGLGVWASTLENAALGYDFYLTPSLDVIRTNLATIIPYAVGQAFFSLTLGMGAMITYSSYLGEDTSLPSDGITIAVLNTFVGVLAGFVVFPVLFNFNPGINLAQAGGAGTAFVALGAAFASLGSIGRVLAFVFFIVLFFAAISSSISLLEVVTAYVTESTEYSRPPVAFGLGFVVFLFGIPAAVGVFGMSGITTLGWYNDIAYSVLLPVSVFFLAVFLGWTYAEDALSEIRQGASVGRWFDVTWLWFVRIVIPVATLFTLVLGIQSLLVKAGVLESAIILG